MTFVYISYTVKCQSETLLWASTSFPHMVDLKVSCKCIIFRERFPSWEYENDKLCIGKRPFTHCQKISFNTWTFWTCTIWHLIEIPILCNFSEKNVYVIERRRRVSIFHFILILCHSYIVVTLRHKWYSEKWLIFQAGKVKWSEHVPVDKLLNYRNEENKLRSWTHL